jgi:glycosyltransferase involved in cell wall biosynthesis
VPAADVVTVAIPVRDAGRLLGDVLRAVGEQEVDRQVEVLVCDSGSGDGSAELARELGATVFCIPPQDFSHGATRNLLMERARGAHVAFLTQDAVPASPHWLARLLAGFGLAENVGLTLGPYVARPGAPPEVANELARWFGSFTDDDAPRIDVLEPAERDLPALGLFGRRTFFTDANGCVSRAAWERVPFRDVPYAEDQQLALDMLRAGFAKVYLPDAPVIHSHEYRPRELVRRCFDEWRALHEVYGFVEPVSIEGLRVNLARPVREDLRAAGSRSPLLALRSACHHVLRYGGALLGSRAHRMPERFRRRLSLERRP